MKRELKFRAFVNGAMYYNHSVTIQIDGTVSCLTHLGDWIDDEEGIVKIMQSTGLKDKNGITIYEGDIVSVPYITPFGENTESEDEEKRTHIVFEFGEFSLKYPNHNESLKSWCKRTEGEYISNYGNKTIFEDITVLTVIGNIHELNQTK